MLLRFQKVDSHWQGLSRWFNPTATRLFISWFAITPIFIKLIESMPEDITFTDHHGNIIAITPSLPFSWSTLWVASFLYAISFCLYVLRCPKFIKDYRSYDEYKQHEHSPRWLVWEFFYAWSEVGEKEKSKLFKRLNDKALLSKEFEEECTPEPVIEENGTKFIFNYSGTKYRYSFEETSPEEKQREAFWEVFGRWSSANSVSRYASWILLVISILLVSVVVVQNIYFVLKYILGFNE